MKHLRIRVLFLVLPVLCLLVLPSVPAAQTTLAAPAIDKSTPYGEVGNLAVNVRQDEVDGMLGLIKESGTQWHREDFSWERLQPAKDAPFRWGGDGYGFLYFDEAVEKLHNSGIKILGLLAYNPAWFKGKNPPLDAWIGDWQNYVYNVVARYGRQRGQVKHWEVWNESNLRDYGYANGLYSVEDYARLLQVTYATIKQADPQATVVMGGLASIWSEVPPDYYDTFDYLERLGKLGAWAYFDVLNLHAYRPGAPEGRFQRRERTMDFDDEMKELDALMNQYGSKPIWFTEIGWGSYKGAYSVTEIEQAYYLVRFYALSLSYPNVERLFWYNFRNNLAYWTPYDKVIYDETVPDWHMGLIRRTYPLKTEAPELRKPAFKAFRTMTNLLGGLPQSETVADGKRADLPGVFWYRYGNGGERGAQLLWQFNAAPISVTATCACTEARLRRWDGALLRILHTDTGSLSVAIPGGGEPVYLEYGPDRTTGGQYFRETGHSLGGPFFQYWQRNGGLAQFGYPITGELIESDPTSGRARRVQYFERNRFEYFPENTGTPYTVQLGRLGDDQLRQGGLRWQDAPVKRDTPKECRRFPETKRLLCPPFRAYWEKRGGLSMYGLPLTDAFYQNGWLIQYFERNRFEYHPENAGTPYEVLLGLLGVEVFGNQEQTQP
jgi:hypothetical protein